MSQLAELEYSKLLDNENVNQELVNQPQFYKSFIRKFDELSFDGKLQVEINVGTDSITLFGRREFPNATNGLFVGYKDVTGVKFSLENLHEHKYFRVDRECSSVYMFPNRGDKLSNTLNSEVYEDNVLLGRVSFGDDMTGKNFVQKATPYLGFRKPDLSAGYVLQGMIPEGMDYLVSGDYYCHVEGRTSYEQGLVRKSNRSRKDGEYELTSSLAAVNLENTLTIDNSTDVIVYDNMGQVVRNNTCYNSPKEAIEAIQAQYKEAIGKGKTM